MTSDPLIPGYEVVDPGLADLQVGKLSEPALAVLAAAPRLRDAGVRVPQGFDELAASHALYARLATRLDDGAHSYHHALMRRVLSYAKTIDALRSQR